MRTPLTLRITAPCTFQPGERQGSSLRGAAGDVGLIPWVPLAQFDGPPEPILRQCPARIDRDAPPNEHENLLAVAQFLTGLRYNNPRLFQILEGRKAMIESPVLQELKGDWTRETLIKAVIDFRVARFGAKAEALETELQGSVTTNA
jgi:hypothetical protein